jgi:hypothetical protein
MCSRVKFTHKTLLRTICEDVQQSWLHSGIIQTAVQPTLWHIFVNSKRLHFQPMPMYQEPKRNFFDGQKGQKLEI